MVNKYIIVLLASILFISGCSSVHKPELSDAESIKAKSLLSIIKKINDSSPGTILSSFTADGNAGEKKFRVEGRAAFDKKGYYKVTITDYVFQSPVIEAYRELDRLYFYYPVEKKLFADDVNKIDLSRYTGFKTDYNLLYTLLTGGMPVIDNYSVYKCLYDETEKGYNLIIENEDFFENIFFKDDLPVKILFIHKLTRNKAEIYFKSMIKKDKSIFFKEYKIVAPDLNTSISISYLKPLLNTPVSVGKLKMENLPKKVEVIQVN